MDDALNQHKTGICYRLLRFRLRTLLLFVLVFAGFFAWIGDDLIRSRLQRSIVTEINASGGKVYFDYQVGSGPIRPDTPPPGSQAVRSLFGDDIYATATCVAFHDPQTDDGDVKPLHRLSGLLDVILSGAGVTDECVDDLLRIRRLRSLSLSDTSISPEGMAKLSSSTTLQQLTLYGSNLTDQHVAKLAGYPNLQFLQIIRAPITDDGLRAIGEIHALKQLDIYQCNAVTDAGIQALDQLTHLERLEILQPSITDASMEAISKMHSLRTLRLDGSVSDVGFDHLKSLSAIEVLRLHDTDVGDDALATIAQFKRLKFLDLSGTRVSDAGLPLLSALNELSCLDLCRTNVTNAGLRHLIKLPSLTSLSVEIKSGITLDGVDWMKSRLPGCSMSCWDLEADGSGWLTETR